MAEITTLEKVKTDLRIRHAALDEDIKDMIDACIGDLKSCGIVEPNEEDALILHAIKLWCHANYTDETNDASAYLERYNACKGSLMLNSAYTEEKANEN